MTVFQKAIALSLLSIAVAVAAIFELVPQDVATTMVILLPALAVASINQKSCRLFGGEKA